MIRFVLSPVLSRHTFAYLDNVVRYSADFADLLKDLDDTFAILGRAEFKLNVDKCKFVVDELKLVGFVVSVT